MSAVDDAIARMRAIREELDQGDGAWWFNELYLRMTEAVRDRLASLGFVDAAFMAELDARFAARWFEAFAQAQAGNAPSPAWRPLFDARYQARAPVQFAFAGMNAHINYDLCIAVVDTLGALGRNHPFDDEYADYCRINDVLETVQEQVKREFEDAVLRAVDGATQGAGDAVVHWDIVEARAAAWSNAMVLWDLREREVTKGLFLAVLSRTVGFAGRGLMVPTGAAPALRAASGG